MKSWVSRFRNHFSSNAAAKKNPTAALESLERWSARAAAIIFVGIALEAWETIHFQKPTESNWEIAAILIADAAVGAGLIIEIVCILRAIVETRREKRESDEKISVADRAAAEAKRETEKIKAIASWRTLTDDERTAIKSSLDTSGEPASLRFVVLANDPESLYFAQQLALPFKLAGWHVGYRFESYTHAPLTNICLPPIAANWLDEQKTAALKVRDALVAADISFAWGWPINPYMSTDSTHPLFAPIAWMYVGPKPMPRFEG